MRNKMTNLFWGFGFLVLGVFFAGNILFDWQLNLFHLFFAEGWWTLCIIIPCTISLIQNGPNTGSIFGIIIGFMILLAQQDIFSFHQMRQLIIPAVFILIGSSFIVKTLFPTKHTKKILNIPPNSKDYSAVFSGQKINFNQEVFEGATINAIFGGIDLNLANAIISEDVVIECSAIFGGIDIKVPYDVNVSVTSTPIFGGVDNKRRHSPHIENAPTIYINAACMFGGVDIK